MHTFFHPDQLKHAPSREFINGQWVPYLESPARVEAILQALQAHNLPTPQMPRDFGLAPIAQVHREDYLTFLQTAHARWVAENHPGDEVRADTFFRPPFQHYPDQNIAGLAGVYCFDLSVAITAHTWAAAYWAAQCALSAAQLVAAGAPCAFALCRPPGHHAHAEMGGGYCLLNNAAIAAHWLTQQGARVAVLDVDYHHGNGTQAIFYDRCDVFVASLHADPRREYPYFWGSAAERGVGKGEGFNLNIPLPAAVDDAAYLDALEIAIQAIARYAPDALVVSFGADTFSQDPLGDFALSAKAFPRMGARLARLRLRTVVVMEGGYAVQHLGDNTVRFLLALGD